jgi:alpha-tubulin suppressor-like RCC1 family protein
MHGWIRKGRVRRIAITLGVLWGGVLSGVSCRGSEIAEPTVASTASELHPALASTTTNALWFRQVSTGWWYSCGVTTDDRAYCWGSGPLGTGMGYSVRPVAVAGGLRFRQVSAGKTHACAVTTDDRAYCWGRNFEGQLGDGTTNDSPTPVAVAGGRRFHQVAAGWYHSCGVNRYDVAFCWGFNNKGQLGDGTFVQHLAPVRVTGGLRFRHVVPDGLHTCGVNTESRAFCWGSNTDGQLGDGTTVQHRKPAAVAGGLSFRQVSTGATRAGSWHAVVCGVTTDDRAYCWGDNDFGQLGDGTLAKRLRPTPVAGDLRFGGVSTGGEHSCGVATGGLAYCWGRNEHMGQLGDGTYVNRLTPVAVSGGLVFREVSSGWYHTCGVTTDDRAYCWGGNSPSTPAPVLDPM